MYCKKCSDVNVSVQTGFVDITTKVVIFMFSLYECLCVCIQYCTDCSHC